MPYGNAGKRTSFFSELVSKSAVFAAFIGLAVFALPGNCLAQAKAQDIIARSVQAGKADWNAEPNYECMERDRTKDGTKTFADMMIEGSPYQRLVAINGKPLPEEQQKEQQKAVDEAVSERQSESPEEKQKRIGKYEKQRQRDHLLLQELTKAFEFTVVGQQRLNGRDVYVLQATPRAGYHPPNVRAEVLTGMTGRLWIDKATYQWVKVTAQVVHPVQIEGFLAKVEPGAFFELEKTPVDGNIWLPSHFTVQSHAKILSLVPHNMAQDETYNGCHPIRSQTQTSRK